MSFLTAAEITALIAAPDPNRWEGRRDRAMMLLAVQTGLRVSELIGLNCADVTLGDGAHVRCEGKGRKHRAVPLTGPVINLSTFGSPNAPGDPATRCSAPGPAAGSAATPSRYASAPTPRPLRNAAPPWPANGSTHTCFGTAAP